jgi:hypothetical protein
MPQRAWPEVSARTPSKVEAAATTAAASRDSLRLVEEHDRAHGRAFPREGPKAVGRESSRDGRAVTEKAAVSESKVALAPSGYASAGSAAGRLGRMF